MAENGRACPYDSANVFSKILFWWLNPFFKHGSKHQLTSDNLCDVSKHDESKLLETELERFWKIELQKHAEGGKPRLLFAVFKAFKWQFILPGFLLFFVEALKLTQPILIGILVSYLNGEAGSVTEAGAYGVGAGLGLSGFLLVCFNPTAFFLLQHVAMRMKVAVGALIYRKVLTLSAEAFQYTSAGQIVNHLSTDIEKFNEVITVLHYFWISPLSIATVMFLMYQLVGVACFWGLAVIAVIVPIQSGFASLFGRLRYRIAAIADQRIQFMTETIMGMRVIKMHCWEFPFKEVIMKLRRSEINLTRLGNLIESVSSCLENLAPRITSIVIIISLSYYRDPYSLMSKEIYTLVGLCDSLRYTGFFYVYHAVGKSTLLNASLIRIQAITFAMESPATRLMSLAVILALLSSSSETSATSGVVFTLLGVCEIMRNTAFYFMPNGAGMMAQLLASLYRVQTFLLLDEKKDQIKDLRPTRSIHHYNDPDTDWAVDVDHMTARWPLVYKEGARRFQRKHRSRSSTSSTKSLMHESDTDHAFSLKYMSFQVKKKELVAVVGVVGSGKSSLLMSLIGELPFDIGQISINGKISYCAQTPWIFRGTARDNILFGKEFVGSFYQDVVKACGLARDFQLFPRGDMTYVGERGLQLSGGQKARISLARCVYHDSDIVLLDDPLSAVDANVGGHIFERCITELLAEKTVILVTHQLQYLKRCDRIVVLRDGSIHDMGTYDELKSKGMDMRALIATDNTKQVTDATLEAEEEEKQIMLESKMMETEMEEADEDVASGSVGFSVYWNYFRAGFGHFLIPIVIPLWIGGPALFCFSDWMLAQWIGEQDIKADTINSNPSKGTTKSSGNSLEWSNMTESFQLYIIGLLASLGFFMAYSIISLQMGATAGSRLHDKMLVSIINSVCRFFDTRPVGQVLNRFSRDLGIIDDVLACLVFVVSRQTLQFLGFIIVTLIVNPWLLIALVPLLVVVILIRLYSVRTLRQVKRLEAKARSPVFSHVSDTVLGLETIRSLGKRDQFLAEFDLCQNRHTSAWFLYLSSYRWMSVRMLFAVVIYLNAIIFVSLQLVGSLNGNLLALSLLYIISMGEPFEYYMRATADLETYMTSVERVLSYCKLDQEAAKISDKPLSPDWPTRGAITFSKTCLKYSHDGPSVLRQIDCHIKGKEKIGIVGRTGSGKSSLIAALFRLAEPTGLIFVDGTDVGKVGIHDLRKKISVIPQDPFLFSHTLRWNLDPLEEYSDERLWKALEQVQLKEKVEHMNNKLYTEMQEGGQNLSVGQRQLVCLARAILKCNRILILDEATANVDEETDAIIQRTIRSRFRESTVLTIAHRLYTIMDCDQIMVLSDGELKEFDTPHQLLQNPDGYFSQLVASSGKNQAKQLKALAELSQHKRTSASIQHQRAMLLATEQLAQSMEDLRQGQAALHWNRFNMNVSSDSLDKIDVDSPVESRKRPLGPSQKIIRRKSPGRTKRPDDEGRDEPESGLISYDSPPRTVHAFTKRQPHSSSRGNERQPNDSEINGNKNPVKSRDVNSESSPSSRHHVEYEQGDHAVQYRKKDKRDWRYKESDIDSPDSEHLPSSYEDSKWKRPPRSGYEPERNSSSASNQPLLLEKYKADLPPSSQMRILSGNYVPQAQQEDEDREQFV